MLRASRILSLSFLAAALALPGSGLAGPLRVNAGAQPEVVSAGQETTIWAIAVQDDDFVPGAMVELSVGGGTLRPAPGTLVFPGGTAGLLRGRADAQGRFQAHWSCSPCASRYVVGVKVEALGREPATASVPLQVGPAQVVPGVGKATLPPQVETLPPQALSVQLDAWGPGGTSPGRLLLSARVQDASGQPASGVAVTMTNVNGRFLPGSLGYPGHDKERFQGRTDDAGRIWTEWQCYRCTGSYSFEVEASRSQRGSSGYRGRLAVELR